MRCPVQKHSDGVKDDKGRQVQRVLGPPREITIQLVVDAIPQVSLLEQSPLSWVRLPLGKEGRQGRWDKSAHAVTSKANTHEPTHSYQ